MRIGANLVLFRFKVDSYNVLKAFSNYCMGLGKRMYYYLILYQELTVYTCSSGSTYTTDTKSAVYWKKTEPIPTYEKVFTLYQSKTINSFQYVVWFSGR